VLLVLRVPKVLRVLRAIRVLLVLRVPKVLRVLRAIRALKESLEKMARGGRRKYPQLFSRLISTA
jgi:hypothetical protein